MTHLTRAELVAWRDTPAELDRGRIVGHLAECDACTALYAELIRARAPEPAAAHFDREAFAKRGYGAVDAPSGRLLVFQRKLFIPLAAAAALLLVLWLPSTRRAAEESGDPAPVMRGGRPHAEAPAGAVRGPIEFRWTSPVPADRYAVEVKDAAGQRVFYRETRDTALRADASLDGALRPGVRFSWTVTALDAAGEAISQSAPRDFSRTPTPQ